MSNEYYYNKIRDGLIDPPEETPRQVEQAQQVWNYKPLVHNQAQVLASCSNMDYDDLCAQGYLILAELAYSIDWSMPSKRISRYIKATVKGKLRNYLIKWRSMPVESTNKLVMDSPTAEEQVIRKEQLEMAHLRVASLISTFSERETYVLWNHIVTDEPETIRDMAEQFQCGKSSISRDIQRVKKELSLEDI